jgi:hypothetical protein
LEDLGGGYSSQSQLKKKVFPLLKVSICAVWSFNLCPIPHDANRSRYSAFKLFDPSCRLFLFCCNGRSSVAHGRYKNTTASLVSVVIDGGVCGLVWRAVAPFPLQNAAVVIFVRIDQLAPSALLPAAVCRFSTHQ